MTNEEKKELLIALCGYYPYGVICHDTDPNDPNWSKDGKLRAIRPEPSDCNGLPYLFELEGMSFLSDICEIKPYLRPMESMTTEEAAAYTATMQVKEVGREKSMTQFKTSQTFDYLDRNFFDYRGLIPRGMALPACEGMYNLKKEG